MDTDLSIDSPLARARTLLFVPGNQPERFEKALSSGADAVVVDLEDSVPAAEKQATRQTVAAAWEAVTKAVEVTVPVVVHINGMGTAAGRDDLAIGDTLRLQTDVQRALNFGFGGKLCIHPRQVPVVHAAMTPSDAELDWARRVVAADQASGGAAVQLDGRMVDLPVVLQARRTLARARRKSGA